ncbi:MAG: COG1470 family protein [Bryobacteraceae bacterium]
MDATHTDYEYAVQLSNTGGPLHEVQADLALPPVGATVLDPVLLFGDVAAASSGPGINTITIQRDPSQSFDPATLQWNVTQPGVAVTVPLIDNGPFDAATGDGLYTGAFVPSGPGTYAALLSITGTSLAGTNFSRTAATRFRVTAQTLAKFVSFSDAAQGSDLAETANINVTTAGTYRFSLQLQGANQSIIAQESAAADLPVGSQQISLVFSSAELSRLGAGPYQRINAWLYLVDNSGDLTADWKANAGTTGAFTPFAPSLAKPALSFTGQNSTAGIITGIGPKFDLLRSRIGISSASLASCSWSAQLTDAAGKRVDYATGNGSVPAGASAVTLNFNGIKIARSAGGPYTVDAVTLLCGSKRATARTLYTIPGFPPSQFTFIPADFVVNATGPAAPAGPGSPIRFSVRVSSVGAFDGRLGFTLSGLPTGATATFSPTSIAGSGTVTLTISQGTAAAGRYALSITATSGPISRSTTATLIITAKAP